MLLVARWTWILGFGEARLVAFIVQLPQTRGNFRILLCISEGVASRL
jgi:hypothetical protein